MQVHDRHTKPEYSKDFLLYSTSKRVQKKKITKSTRIMDPSKSLNGPLDERNSWEKSGMLQPAPPPPYQDHPEYPNAGNPPPYPGQQYGAPVGMIPQGPYPEHPVTVQPTVYVTSVPLTNPLPDYLGYSIFTMLCCCLPLGIAALVYSCSTRNANRSGHQQLAEKNSSTARTLNNVGLGIGLVFFFLNLLRFILAIYSKHHWSP